ncbi:MAG: HAD family hydrolase [Oscillospiraceae bacterium]|jgi:Cof subfamily protein (haloacid dehalogenase superfamily)|nr:HAD family hydrolase [Oscillospiraceae bacterium]
MSKIFIDPAMPRKLTCIVSDMDGTILPPTFRLSERTIAAFKRAQSLGIKTILASGRSGASMRPYWEQLGGGNQYIGSNGAQTFDGAGNLMHEETIEVDTAREIIRYLRAENVYCQTYYDERFYHESKDNPMPERYEQTTGLRGVHVPDLEKYIDRPVVKILGIDYPEHVVSMMNTLAKKYRGKLNVSISDPHFLEIAPINATKGKAMAKLAEIIGVEREHTLALGDSLNDLPMLKWAGMSCAVGSCHADVRSVCAWNAGECAEDGAAVLIETLLDEGFGPK